MTKIISPNGHIGTIEYLKSIWKSRHLTVALAKGEIKNQSSLNVTGIFLNIIQSLIGLAVYWIVFGIALNIKIKTGEIPYPIFVLPGIFIWHYFSAITGYCSNCFILSQNFIGKLYFPRICIPLSKVLLGMVDFAIGIVLFIILFICFGQSITINWAAFPLIVITIIIFVTTIGLWISFISLFSMDTTRIAAQLTNFLIFITPVFYPGTIIPDNFKFILYINPVAGIIEYSRWSLLGAPLPSSKYLIGIAITLVLTISIFFIYKKYEKKITDLL